MLSVQTRGGTLKIEAGEGIDASVVKEQMAIRDTVSGKTYEVSVGENSLRPGQYEIVLRDPASGLKVSTERVEIQRGHSTPLRITLQGEVAVAGKEADRNQSGSGSRETSDRTLTSSATKPVVVLDEKAVAAVLTGLQVGPVVNTLEGIIPRPARLPGVARWQAVTAEPRNGVNSVAWSKLGQIVASDGSNQLRCYDATSLELRRFVGPYANRFGPVTVLGDGKLMTWGSRFFRLGDPDFMRESSLGNPVISPNGKLLAG